MSQKFVVIDLETTGNSPKKGDRIIQFGAVIIENGKITGQFASLVNPLQEIPVFIEELTGISDSMVKDAPLFAEIAPQISDMLKDAYFVAHNVLFDLSFLQEELLSAGCEGFYGPVLDTVEMARILYPTADSFKLTDLAARENLRHERPHQADSDAYVTAELLLIMLDALNSLPHVTLKELAKLSEGLKSDLHLIFDEALNEKEYRIETLPADIEVFRGIALKKRTITKTEKRSIDYPQSAEDKKCLLEKAFKDFESRQGQYEMMDLVHEAFNRDGHALIEAGTGVGKSLGYLIPAAIFSLNNNKPVIISTYTTQLQEQLLTNDVPKLADMFESGINVALIKGRSHYISMARFEQSLRELEENYDTALTKMQILVWLTETETGDFDELNLSSGGMLFWNKIRNERSMFLRTKHWEEHDFYKRAIDKAKDADLLITNHSMLLADLVSGGGSLPEYEYAVLDEGHQFEKAAGKYFGKSLDFMAVRLLLNQLGQYDQTQLFYKIETMLSKTGITAESSKRLHTFEINQLITDLVYETDELFKMAGMYARKAKKSKPAGSKIHTSLAPDKNNRIWAALQATAERFYFLVKDLEQALGQRLDEAGENAKVFTRDQQALLEEVVLVRSDLESIRSTTKALFMDAGSSYVRWIEADIRALQNSTTIFARPVHVADYLADQFFNKKRSVIVTSATLSVNYTFEFIKKELGLAAPVFERLIPSPFSYETQVQLVVPDDLPEIKSVSNDEYVAAITEHIISIAEATRGRMLILFTSHEMLRKAYELIKESGLLEEFVLIAQGITAGSRTRLTRNFKRFDKAILFGTSSFWEGVDIPGEDLSCLIIVRLPFSPPDEPLTAAKCALIQENGGNPFTELSLPEAILRFKQGFGRLIRTSSDRGMIFIFDRRLLTTAYGKSFLSSIPDVAVKKGSINEIVESIHDWL